MIYKKTNSNTLICQLKQNFEKVTYKKRFSLSCYKRFKKKFQFFNSFITN
jgi:hypothetical protein